MLALEDQCHVVPDDVPTHSYDASSSEDEGDDAVEQSLCEEEDLPSIDLRGDDSEPISLVSDDESLPSTPSLL